MSKKKTLTKWTFDFKGAHLAYTDASVGGAASGYNSPILLKAKGPQATPEILEIIKDLEEELTPLDKTLGVSNADSGKQNTPSTSGNANEAVMAGDDKKVLKGKEKTMSEQDLIKEKAEADAQAAVIKALQEQVAAMALENSKEKAKNLVSKYALESVVAEGLANALAVLPSDAKEAVVKALDVLSTLVADKTEELNKAKAIPTNSAQEAIVKAAQEATSVEKGHSSEAELPSQLTSAEQRAEAIAKAYEQLANIEKSKGAK